MSFLRSFACRWCIALVLHELLLATPVLANAVSSLFSPGPHTPWTSLGIAASFLILRVFVILLWPIALVSAARGWSGSGTICARWRQLTPSSARPSAPNRASDARWPAGPRW